MHKTECASDGIKGQGFNSLATPFRFPISQLVTENFYRGKT